MAKSVAINVGVNTKKEWGGFRGPIFPDGTFEFIHIPWKKKYGVIEPKPKKYSEMCYAPYVPFNMLDKCVLISPDFCNCTYASTDGAKTANKSILNLGIGDILFFYATLCYYGEKGKEKWINPNWGAYIIGFFKISSKYDSIYHVLADEFAIETFQDYDWFKVRLNDPHDLAPWIKGKKGESGLLHKAIPLSSPESGQKRSCLAYDLFRTSRGKKLTLKTLIYRTILTCEGERLDTLLDLCVLRKKSRRIS